MRVGKESKIRHASTNCNSCNFRIIPPDVPKEVSILGSKGILSSPPRIGLPSANSVSSERTFVNKGILM